MNVLKSLSNDNAMQYITVERMGDVILHRYKDKNGKTVNENVEYEPTLWIKSDLKTGYETIKGINVKPRTFQSMSDANTFIREFDTMVNGMRDFELSFIHEFYPNDIAPNYECINIMFLDIETESKGEFPNPETANQPINAISFYSTNSKEIKTLTTLPKCDLANIKFYSTEKELLRDFIKYVIDLDIDVLSGWNSEFFDLPYILRRSEKILTKREVSQISPFGRYRFETEKTQFGDEQTKAKIFGRVSLDLLMLYRKHIGISDSYKLGNIAQKELGITKVEYEGTLQDLSEQDPKLFLEYNKRDVELLVELENKLQILKVAFGLSYLMKCNFVDSLGTLKMWQSKIVDYIGKDNKILDWYHPPKEDVSFTAAFVKEPIAGKYKYVSTLDATSMYPTAIMDLNISPEKKINNPPDELRYIFKQVLIDDLEAGEFTGDENLKKYNLCVAGNGQMYSRDGEGILPSITRTLFDRRKKIKKEMLSLEQKVEKAKAEGKEFEKDKTRAHAMDIQQHSLKIALNSLFGAVGNKYFPLFDIDSAEAITLTGQAFIKFVSKRVSEWISKVANDGEFKDYVIYIDTDSLAINLEDIVNKYKLDGHNVDTISKLVDVKIQEVVNRATKEFSTIINKFNETSNFKREKISCSDGAGAVYLTKKRYFMGVDDNEGVRYAEPKLYVTGLESERTSTPQVVRNALLEAYSIILKGSEKDLQNYIKEFEEKFKKMGPEEIAFPRGVSDIEKYSSKTSIYTKGCPIHTRAALLYNYYIKDKKLDSKYPLIKSGDKIRFLILNKINPIAENVIGWVDKFPKELALEKFVDYDIMFNNTFKEPLKAICEKIGWEVESKVTLDDLF